MPSTDILCIVLAMSAIVVPLALAWWLLGRVGQRRGQNDSRP
jgi:hypothetical protein